MNKSFTDIFIELAGEKNAVEAKRIVKALEANGIDSIERLVNMTDDAISALKGIGPRALHVIGEIKTREQFKADKKISDYKKLKGKQVPKTFNMYLQLAGCSYLEACRIEHIVKKNGCATIDDFMIVGENCYDGWSGIGPKRKEKLIATHDLIAKDMKKRMKISIK